jgi:hypothetical protein
LLFTLLGGRGAQKEIYELSLKRGDILNLVLKSIIQFGEEKKV